MAIRYSGLLTRAQQQAFDDRVAGLLSDWVKAWFAPGGDAFAAGQGSYADALFSSTEVSLNELKVLCRGNGWLLSTTSDAAKSLAEMAIGCSAQSSADRALAEHLEKKMAAAVTAALKSHVECQGELDAENTFDRAAWFEFELAGQTVTLMLSGEYLHRFAAAQLPSRTLQSCSLKQMVASQPVSLSLNIDSRKMTVGQMMSLEVGHVVELSQLIREPLMLEGQPDQTRLSGYLVRLDGQKAVYLSGIAK